MNGQCRPRPELRARLRDALTADRESFREAVGRLAAEHEFAMTRHTTPPDGFDRPLEVGAATDPTGRLLWRALTLETAPIGVVLTGAAYRDTPVLYANRATRRLTGYSLEDLRGGNLRRLQGPQTDPEPVGRLRTALRNWNPTTVEVRNHRADGTPFTNRVSLVPVPDQSGTVTHWFGLQAAVPDDE